MKVRIANLGPDSFEATAESSTSTLVVQGMQPTELLLASVASCSAMDVRHILERQKQPAADISVDITAARRETVPTSFTALHLAFTVRGEGLDDHKVQRAVMLSVEKYCPVARSLDPQIALTWSARTTQ